MDSGDTASVNFNNSGVNTFSENITVTLDNTGAAVYLNGDVTTSGTLSITGAYDCKCRYSDYQQRRRGCDLQFNAGWFI